MMRGEKTRTVFGVFTLVLLGVSLAAPAWSVEPIRRMAACDLNLDGVDELILLDRDANELRVFSGDPLAEADTTPFPAPDPVDLTAGYFSQAETPEIGLSSWLANSTQLFPTNLPALGTPFPITSNGGGPTRLRSGNLLDKEGRDLLVLFSLTNRITLYGPEIGRYPPEIAPQVSLTPRSFTIRDFAVAELPDVGPVMAVLGETESGSFVELYRVDPTSTLRFALVHEIPLEGSPDRIESLPYSPTADHFAVVSSSTGTRIVFLPSNLEYPPLTVELGGEYSAPVSTDLNVDGNPDVALVQADGQGVLMMQGMGGNDFTQQSIPNPGKNPIIEAAFGRFVSSDTVDLILYYEGPAAGKPESALATEKGFWVLPGDGKGGFGEPIESPVSVHTPAASGYANVVLVKNPIPAEGPATVYQSFHVPDWTTAIGPVTAGEATVERAIVSGGHLVAAPTYDLTGISVPGSILDYTALINEDGDDKSTFFFDMADPTAKDLVVAAFPAGGTYEQTVEVDFRRDPGVTIYYRRDGGPTLTYTGTPPLDICEDTTLTYYGSDGINYSPTYTASYVITRRSDADTDSDSIPDFIEVELGYDALRPDGDSDGDGWDTFAELVRGSNPRDGASVPVDSDKPAGAPGDGWPDFDEVIRGTDPLDPGSAPVASGQGVAEYLLTGIPQLVTPAPKPSESETTAGAAMTEGSRVEFYSLGGALIASASVQSGSFDLRLAGDQPYIIKAVDAGNVDLVLLAYMPSYEPCLDLSGIYTPGMTAAEWLTAYRALYAGAIFRSFSGSVNENTTAVVFALNRFYEGFFTDPSAPPLVLPGTSEISPAFLDALVRPTYDLNTVAGHISANIGSAPTLLSIVHQYLDWGASQNTSRPIHELIARGIAGVTPLPADTPPGVAPADFAAAAGEIDAILGGAPTLIRNLTGTLEAHPDGFVSLTDGPVTYELDLSSFSYNLGAQVNLTGRIIPRCDGSGVTLLQVTSLTVIDSGVAGNEDDSDGDGLNDQWEYFYFGNLSALPDDDPDTDTFVNSVEYEQFTDPLDGNSYPGMYSPTPTPTDTPTSTPTPTVTATPTLSPAAYDLNGDGIVDAEDLLLFIHDMHHDPTASRSNFDGTGEIDWHDLYLFGTYWHQSR